MPYKGAHDELTFNKLFRQTTVNKKVIKIQPFLNCIFKLASKILKVISIQKKTCFNNVFSLNIIFYKCEIVMVRDRQIFKNYRSLYFIEDNQIGL